MLVGGQALYPWLRYYDIPIPDGDTALLTEDTDFLGKKEHAIALGAAMGDHVTVRVAELSDKTDNVATLTWRSPYSGQTLMIDVMGLLIGLENKDVFKRAQRFQDESGQPFEIIHPFDLLKSRLENIHQLPSKQTTNGVLQANLAVEICRHYILELLTIADDKPTARPALRMAHSIGWLARSKAGAFCTVGFGIDPLAAVDATRFTPFPLFAERDWQNNIRWANRAREREIDRLKRAAAVQRKRTKLGAAPTPTHSR